MLLALSDTHRTESPSLTEHLASVIDGADIVVHAGDFTTPTVLDAFQEPATLRGVWGNSDEPGVRDRLPETRTVEWADRRLVVAHGHRHDPTSLSLLARQAAASIAIVGHTHRGTITTHGDITVVNPGSHAEPRGGTPTYARFERAENGVVVRLQTVTGEETGLEATV